MSHRFKNYQDQEMYLYEEITKKIIGCAFEVHKTLGNGFQEVIYQRALAIEMEYAGMGFAREEEMSLFYRKVNIGSRRVDFLVEDKILVELKAQGLNYLEAFDLEVGLLLNFGSKSLEVKRLQNNKLQARPNSQSRTSKNLINPGSDR